MKDAYDEFFEKYPKDEFFNDSFEQIIFITAEKIDDNWIELKNNLISNKKLFIRGHGRDALGTNRFILLYEFLFKNTNIEKDPSNNYYPTKLIKELTNYCKVIKDDNKDYQRIQNYQISHLFGRTKNPLMFNAPWNIAYIPKYLDPFTGHETQGKHKEDFQKIFNAKVKEKFRNYIIDYNEFVENQITPNLDDAFKQVNLKLRLKKKEFDKFKKIAKKELAIIEIV